MGTYYIPRSYKGETRILVIFTIKSLITTAIGVGFGSIFYLILLLFKMKTAGLIVMAFFGLIGYLVGAVKIPTIVGIPVTKKIGGEPLSEIILRYFKFKKNRKIYTYFNSEPKYYTKEEK